MKFIFQFNVGNSSL